MKRIIVSLVLLLMALSVHANQCSTSYCTTKKDMVNRLCFALEQPGGLIYGHENTPCWCKCDDLTSILDHANTDSLVALPVGGSVLATREKDSAWTSATAIAEKNAFAFESPYPYAIYMETDSGSTLISTPEHLLYTVNNIGVKVLKRADRLTPNDQLMGSDGEPTAITVLAAGRYESPVDARQPPIDTQSVRGYLSKSGNLLSGGADAFGAIPHNQLLKGPQVGSAQYRDLYKEPWSTSLEALPDAVILGDDRAFIPARPFQIPEGATRFFPGEQVESKKPLRPLDDRVPYEVAQYLVNQHKKLYPEIIYEIKEGDLMVNAYAWVDSQGQRHVALLGGLIRHQDIEQEGVGLVLAHEIGHHYAGGPSYSDSSWGAACEGQADYWAALVSMRRAWNLDHVIDQIDQGSKQLFNLFSVGLIGVDTKADNHHEISFGGCSHPPAPCRRTTYQAGMRLDEKPTCAGDPSEW